MSGRARPTRTGGFTLLEVMVAVAIVGLAVVAWLSAYGSELRALSRAAEVSAATALAEDRLETIELMAPERLPNLPDSLRQGTFPEPLSQYRWDAKARTVAGRDLAEVSVIVTWANGSKALTTLLPVPSPTGLPRP